MDWQPMKTAPRDGTEFLLAWKRPQDPDTEIHMLVVRAEKDGSGGTYWTNGDINRDDDQCIAWMPLPEPPPKPYVFTT